MRLRKRLAAPVLAQTEQDAPQIAPSNDAVKRGGPPARPIRPNARDEAGLNPQQRRFVQHYLVNLNATQSAIRAGYSAPTAGQMGCALLKNPNVAAEIERLQARKAEELELTADMVLRELRLLGFANMQDYMRPGPQGEPVLDFSQLTRDQAAALQEVTVEEFKDGRSDKREVRRTKFKLAAKKDALELLGKHLGLFKEELNVKHDHHHTVVGMLLQEIDQEARAERAKTIEHKPESSGESSYAKQSHQRGRAYGGHDWRPHRVRHRSGP